MSVDYTAISNSAYQLYNSGQYQQATSYFAQLTNAYPNEQAYPYNLGNCYYNQGKYQEAIPYFEKAFTINPDYVDAIYMKGNCLYTLVKYPEAEEIYNKVIEIRPSYYLGYYQKGLINIYYHKDYQTALQLFEKTIIINSSFLNSYTYKGLALYNLHKYSEALEALDKSLSGNPNDYDANYNKALVYYGSEKFVESLPFLDKAMELKPANYAPYCTKGLALMALNRDAEALPLYLKCSELNPSYSDVYINLGITYRKLKRYEESIAAYDKAISMNPGYHLAYNNKASSLQDLGRYEEAIKLYNISIEKNPKFALSYCNRAKCKQNLKQDAEALADLNIAYKLVNDGEGMDNLQSSVQTYIHNVLDNDRKALLAKVQELNDDLAHLEQVSSSNPEAKQRAEKVRENFSQQLGKTINAITSESKKNDDYSEIMKQMKEMQEEIRKLKEDMRDSGAAARAQLKRDFDAFEKRDARLLQYCKTFYWTLFNYIGAYRAMSTGMMKGVQDFDDSDKDKAMSMGLQKIAGYAGQIAQGVPFVGGLISGIDMVIGDLYKEYKTRSFKNKINIITSLVIDSSITEDDLSLKIAKAAVSITQLKTNTILLLEEEKPKGKLAKLSTGIEKIVTKGESKLQSVKETFDTEAKKLALQDVTVLLAYLYKNIDRLPPQFALDEQLKAIVVYGGYDSIVEGGYQEVEEDSEKKSKAEPENSGACKVGCVIF